MREGVCSTIGVCASDIRHRDENFEGALFIWFAYASLDFTFNFSSPLLAGTVIRENVLCQLDEVREDEGECGISETAETSKDQVHQHVSGLFRQSRHIVVMLSQEPPQPWELAA